MDIFFKHRIYQIIDNDIYYTSNSFIIDYELLTSKIGETASTALKADVETIKAIYADYKKKERQAEKFVDTPQSFCILF